MNRDPLCMLRLAESGSEHQFTPQASMSLRQCLPTVPAVQVNCLRCETHTVMVAMRPHVMANAMLVSNEVTLGSFYYILDAHRGLASTSAECAGSVPELCMH